MKLGVQHIGSLVRPRVLTHTFVFQIDSPTDIETWWQNVHYTFKYRSIFQAEQVVETFDKPLEKIFEDLSFGDLLNDSSYKESYVTQIVGFMVLLKNQYFYIDSKEKFEALASRNNQQNELYIVSAAVKIYKGFKISKDGSIDLIDLWENSKNHIWFYCRQHLLPLKHLILFESIEIGDLIVTKTKAHLVIAVNTPNKPSFYKTGSWSSKVFKVLRCDDSSVQKFFPNKLFVISKLPK